MKVDNNFTQQIEAWLDTKHDTVDNIMLGATLLYRIIPNAALQQQIMRRPLRYADKVVYELKKHLQYRLDGLTLQHVRNIDTETIPILAKVVEMGPTNEQTDDLPGSEAEDGEKEDPTMIVRRGKRDDHELLPAKIQTLWDKNSERWNKIKNAFETCKSLNKSCDRYEYLKFMKEAWYTYKHDMKEYDSFDMDKYVESADNDNLQLTKEVLSARSYLSKNKSIFASLKNSDSEDDKMTAANLLIEMQKRVDILVNSGADHAMKESTKNELIALGLQFEKVPAKDTSVQEPAGEQKNDITNAPTQETNDAVSDGEGKEN